MRTTLLVITPKSFKLLLRVARDFPLSELHLKHARCHLETRFPELEPESRVLAVSRSIAMLNLGTRTIKKQVRIVVGVR